jgi:hypothetical protein
MLIELFKDMLEWGQVEGWGQEHEHLVCRWMRQKRSAGLVLVWYL